MKMIDMMVISNILCSSVLICMIGEMFIDIKLISFCLWIKDNKVIRRLMNRVNMKIWLYRDGSCSKMNCRVLNGLEFLGRMFVLLMLLIKFNSDRSVNVVMNYWVKNMFLK